MEITILLSDSPTEKQMLRQRLLEKFSAYDLNIKNLPHGLTVTKDSVRAMPYYNIRRMLHTVAEFSAGFQAARSFMVSDKPSDYEKLEAVNAE